MVEVVLSLGSNQGARRAQLDQACTLLAELGEQSQISSDYCSPALDFDGAEFINRIMLLHTRVDVFTLLSFLQKMEWQQGRQRSTSSYQDRSLDIDIIDYASMSLAWDDLELPHPRAHQRGFVLKPWIELVGDKSFPGMGISLVDLLHACPHHDEVIPVAR